MEQYRALSVHARSSQAWEAGWPLAFPSASFGAPLHIYNRTVANCGFWLEYTSKTPLELVADLRRRMRLFWLRCQKVRLRSIHTKLHYSQNPLDSALLAWYERGIRQLFDLGKVDCILIVFQWRSMNKRVESTLKRVIKITMLERILQWFWSGFNSKTKWSLIRLLKEWISTLLHQESTVL